MKIALAGEGCMMMMMGATLVGWFSSSEMHIILLKSRGVVKITNFLG